MFSSWSKVFLFIFIFEKLFFISNANRVKSSENKLNVSNKKTFDKRVSYPWVGDSTCQHFSVQYADINSLAKWPLTSFPGSGITWTRQIIEGVTGIYTGSWHLSDPSPIKLPGNKTLKGTDNPFCNCTVVDKEHEATITKLGLEDYYNKLHKENLFDYIRDEYGGRGVLLLRNPMDVVFTFRNWQVTGDKVGHAPPSAFEGAEWDEVVEYVAFAWADHAVRWIEQLKQGNVIFYENLLGDGAPKEIERLLDTIEYPHRPVDPERMRCAMSHRNRTDHKRVNKTWRPLKKAHRVKLWLAIHKVQQTLRRRGWPQLPIKSYDLHTPNKNPNHPEDLPQ